MGWLHFPVKFKPSAPPGHSTNIQPRPTTLTALRDYFYTTFISLPLCCPSPRKIPMISPKEIKGLISEFVKQNVTQFGQRCLWRWQVTS